MNVSFKGNGLEYGATPLRKTDMDMSKLNTVSFGTKVIMTDELKDDLKDRLGRYSGAVDSAINDLEDNDIDDVVKMSQLGVVNKTTGKEFQCSPSSYLHGSLRTLKNSSLDKFEIIKNNVKSLCEMVQD